MISPASHFRSSYPQHLFSCNLESLDISKKNRRCLQSQVISCCKKFLWYYLSKRWDGEIMYVVLLYVCRKILYTVQNSGQRKKLICEICKSTTLSLNSLFGINWCWISITQNKERNMFSFVCLVQNAFILHSYIFYSYGVDLLLPFEKRKIVPSSKNMSIISHTHTHTWQKYRTYIF